MRWIRCFSLAGLVAIGLTAQTHAGIFDCFGGKKDKSDSCGACATTSYGACATTGQGCASSAYATSTNCTTGYANGCTTGCTTGCATTSDSGKKGGLLSFFCGHHSSKSSHADSCASSACTTGACTSGACTTANGCTTQVCEPSCAAPAKSSRGGLFSMFSRDKSSSCATTCAEASCACPSGCTSSAVCVQKPAYCTAPPVCVSKPVCSPSAVYTGNSGCTSGCTTGCATTSCGACAPVYQPAAPHHQPVAPQHHAAPVAPMHPGQVHPGAVHEAPKVESLPKADGVETIKPLPPAPKSGAYYQNRIPNQQSYRSEVRRDGLADLFGLSR